MTVDVRDDFAFDDPGTAEAVRKARRDLPGAGIAWGDRAIACSGRLVGDVLSEEGFARGEIAEHDPVVERGADGEVAAVADCPAQGQFASGDERAGREDFERSDREVAGGIDDHRGNVVCFGGAVAGAIVFVDLACGIRGHREGVASGGIGGEGSAVRQGIAREERASDLRFLIH